MLQKDHVGGVTFDGRSATIFYELFVMHCNSRREWNDLGTLCLLATVKSYVMTHSDSHEWAERDREE